MKDYLEDVDLRRDLGEKKARIQLLKGEIKVVYIFAFLYDFHQPQMAIDHLKCD